jgi:hypothetical protein
MGIRKSPFVLVAGLLALSAHATEIDYAHVKSETIASASPLALERVV